MEDQGIMALPGAGMQAPTAAPIFDPASSAAFEEARKQIDPREFSRELLGAAEQADPAAVRQLRQMLAGLRLPQEVIDAMQQMVEIVLRDPQNYAEIRRQMLADGVPEDLLPEAFDPMFFGALRVALDQIEAGAGGQPVQNFAMGGIANLRPIAKAMQQMGRGQDTMLAHITPQEARVLQSLGGIGTINPATGLPEYGLFKFIGNVFKSVGKAISGVVKGIGNAVKSFAKSTVGKIVTSVALGFFLGPAAAGLLGVSSAAGVAAVSGFVGGFGSSVLAGQSLKDALKNGAVGGLTAGITSGITGGAGAFESGSYAGPTTVSGQWDRAVNSGKALLGLAPTEAPAAGTLQYTGEGQVTTPGVEAPTTPTVEQLVNAPAPAPGIPVAPSAAEVTPISAAPAPATPLTAVDQLDLYTGQQPAITAPTVPTVADQGIGSLSGQAPTYNAVDRLDYFTGQQPPVDVTRTFAGTPAAPGVAPTAATGFQQAPSAMDYFKQGEYWQGTKELFSPTSYSNAELIQSPQYQSYLKAGFAPKDALSMASSDLNPGMFRTYGPAVAAGVGALGVMGGFSPKEEPPPDNANRLYGSQTGAQLLASNPQLYGTTPGGAATQYYTPQYLGYGLPTRQYYRPQIAFGTPQYRYTFADGGIASLAKGGTSNFPRKTGQIDGPGTATSDSIPAMLSDGEFVFTAKAVRGMGKGSRRLGAKRMYALMKALEGKA